jgi:hypothetical protein
MLRWNGFAEVTLCNFAMAFDAGARDVLVYGNYITGGRNGLWIRRTSSLKALPSDFIIDSNDFNNLGISGQTEARGIVLNQTENITIRNNLFWQNGATDGADTAGQDIDILDAAGEVNENSDPLRIYHNSFFRSFNNAAAPMIQVDDLRELHVFNNAFKYLGGVGSGTDPLRSIVRFTSAGYFVPPRDEIQRIDTGGATGGSYTLSFNGDGPTASLDWNESVATIETELEALTTINNVSVTDLGDGTYSVQFTGATDGYTDQPLIQVTVDNTTGGTGVVMWTDVNGNAGETFFDGNVYYSPNLMRSGIIEPFAVAATFLQFSASSGGDWQNGNNVNSVNVVDPNGGYFDPEFRNPGAGNFQFSFGDPLHDYGTATTSRGVAHDYLGTRRNDLLPDTGSYEFDETSVTPYSYSPTSQLLLPVAEGEDYNGGDIRMIEAAEPVRVTGNPLTEVTNRPHKNLSHRDNLIGAALDAVLLDINDAFCAPPQDGSQFLSPHKTIASFMRVGHNPDGTIRLGGIDLNSLGFLRIDGLNQMLANLNMGDGTNRIINLLNGIDPTDAAALGQVVQKIGDLMTGQLQIDETQLTDNAIDLLTADPEASGFARLINMARGAARHHSINKGQLDDVESGLQTQINNFASEAFFYDAGSLAVNSGNWHTITSNKLIGKEALVIGTVDRQESGSQQRVGIRVRTQAEDKTAGTIQRDANIGSGGLTFCITAQLHIDCGTSNYIDVQAWSSGSLNGGSGIQLGNVAVIAMDRA